MIKVFLLDDHPILVNTVEAILNDDLEINVVGKSNLFTNATLQELYVLKPDVIVLDISMPERDSFEIVPLLKQELPHLKIIVYTMHSLNRYLQHFLTLGVNGYLIKSAEIGNLNDAVKTVFRNENYFPDSILNQINASESDLEENQLQFTSFEKHLVEELKKQLTNKAIATKLNCSLAKVLTARKNLLIKTGTTNTNDFLTKIKNIL